MRIVSSLLISVAALVTACAQGSPSPATPEGTGASATACPDAVKQAVAAKFPGASVTKCKAENEHGHDQFEVKVTGTGGDKSEADVAPDGTILQIEEAVALDKVPAAVMTAFSSKYPSAKPTGAEKQTRTGKSTTYELKFTAADKQKEVTFAEDGSFLEEE
jgi:hypothetical protein